MEKHLALALAVLNAANHHITLAKRLQKKQRFYNKHRLSKKQKAGIVAQMAIGAYMSAAQVSAIISQPVPKFKGGAPSGIAIHGYEGEEKII